MEFKNWFLWMVLSLVSLILVVGCVDNASKDEKVDGISNNEGKSQLKVLGPNAPFDPNEDIVATDIIEVTGYEVDFSMLPQDNPDERLNIEITSGQSYDIVMINDFQFGTLSSEGALLPLNDLLDEHGEHILNAIGDETWELVTNNDGDILAIPQTNERANIENGVMVREDVLADLNMDHPSNLKELKEVLQVIKDNTDLIPLTGGGNSIPTILSAFGLYSYWNEVDGELVPRIKMPQIEDYMNFMLELKEEGLIDQDWAVNTSSIINEKFAGGKAAMIATDWYNSEQIIPGLDTAVEGAETGWINPLEGVNGELGMQANLYFLKASAIPNSAKNPEEAIKYMNAKLDPENFTFLTMGNEDEHFTKEGNVYEPIQPVFTEKRGSAYWYLNGIDEENYPDMWLARLRRDENLFKAFEDLNKDVDKYAKQDPAWNMPPDNAISKNMTALTQFEEDFFIEVITGNKSINDLSEFIEQWEQEGGTEMIEAVNEWYKN